MMSWNNRHSHMTVPIRLLFALIVGSLALAYRGQDPIPLTGDLVVKDHELGACCGALAVDDLGSFMVVWDAVFFGLGGRAVGPDGLGPSFFLEPYGLMRTTEPVDVAAREDGDFIVVWEDRYYGLWGRRYGLDGEPLADAVQIVDDVDGQAARHPSVAYWATRNGSLAIWADEDPFDADLDDLGVKVRFFNETVIDSEPFLVNTHTEGAQDQPAIAVSTAGSFFTVWRSTSSPDDADGTSIRGRPFTAGGTPLPPVQINGLVAGDQSAPDVAVAVDGRAFVVWRGPPTGSGPGTSIRGRLFDADGIPLTDDFQVNERPAGPQTAPKVAVFDDGVYLVAWTSSEGARGRMISAEGHVRGAELMLNETPDASVRDVDLSVGAHGHFVVSWGADSAAYPAALTSQVVRRFARGTFLDAFETGDLSAWDLVVP